MRYHCTELVSILSLWITSLCNEHITGKLVLRCHIFLEATYISMKLNLTPKTTSSTVFRRPHFTAHRAVFQDCIIFTLIIKYCSYYGYINITLLFNINSIYRGTRIREENNSMHSHVFCTICYRSTILGPHLLLVLTLASNCSISIAMVSNMWSLLDLFNNGDVSLEIN